jgi:hypothetical protein
MSRTVVAVALLAVASASFEQERSSRHPASGEEQDRGDPLNTEPGR